MWIITISIVAAVLLASGALLALSAAQKPVYEARTMPTVRIDEPGQNLVGPDWSGLNAPGKDAAEDSRAGAERHRPGGG
jgi:hypothetical protein